MSDFQGPLAQQLSAFVDFKRSLGYKYTTEVAMLQRFDRWSQTQPGPHDTLTEALVAGWLQRGVLEGERTLYGRTSLIRQVGLYLNTIGQPAFIPEPSAGSRHYTFVPHIFTEHELRRIFEEADRITACRPSTLPVVLPVLFRLLYGCGLRVSEALRLSLEDIDWTDQSLTIRSSKFGKDRVVPMAPSLATVLQEYVNQGHPDSPPSARLFCHRDGSPIAADNVYRRFRDILWYAGIPHRGKGQGPRVHDLRHSFAVHTLKAAIDRQVDIHAMLPVLSTYLGHASVAATEQYVRLTADAFPELRQTLDLAAGWVIPEVAWE